MTIATIPFIALQFDMASELRGFQPKFEWVSSLIVSNESQMCELNTNV